MSRSRIVGIYTGDKIDSYGFGGDHPFCNARIHAFWDEMHVCDLCFQVRLLEPVLASEEQLLLFHTRDYIDKVKYHSVIGEGILDQGDTPAYHGVFEDASYVVGSALDAVHKIMDNELRRAFIPTAGLHHSMPDAASGFCVFNDVGVALRVLMDTYGLERIAMFVQNVDSIFDVRWNESLTWGDVYRQNEEEFSRFNFEEADVELHRLLFDRFEAEAQRLLKLGLVYPGYDLVIKCSHSFNLLEARGAISVSERRNYITRVRRLARLTATTYLAKAEPQGL